ncbi:hypothetical protein HZA43_00685 [Candidatus Peregrinibacteria bacterium]|nr:hypothetical protein [Candidatus Peregrinibacteria bacterium]
MIIKKIYNEELSQAFHEIADLMSLLDENSFKIRAYRKAAENIRNAPPITVKRQNIESFRKIPGVGDAIAEKMMQYVRKGEISALEQLRTAIPQTVRDLLAIPYLGPKRVRDLYLTLGIQSKKELIEKAKKGELDNLRGFGPVLVQRILDAIGTGQEKKRRHPRREVEPIAETLVESLKKIRGVKNVMACGSYRRGAPDVGDLDILVLGEKAAAAAEKMIKKKFPRLAILASGGTKRAFVIFPQNLQVDIRFVEADAWGAALLYFTGNKDYNVMIRKKAIEHGWTLNEYGLFDNQTSERVAGKTEKEIFKKLGLPYRTPEKRK